MEYTQHFAGLMSLIVYEKSRISRDYQFTILYFFLSLFLSQLGLIEFYCVNVVVSLITQVFTNRV